MTSAMTDEELLSMLENSEDDFGLSSGADLGEGDSGDDDVDPESTHQVVQTNITEQQEEDNISDTPVPSTSGYTWSNRKPTLTRIPFTKSKGLKVYPQGSNPIDYFNLLFDDKLFELLVNKTNKYAVHVFLSGSGSSTYRINEWKDTSLQKMKIFIGLLFHTETIRMNRLQDYWKKSELFD